MAPESPSPPSCLAADLGIVPLVQGLHGNTELLWVYCHHQASLQAVLSPPFRSVCILCVLAAALVFSARVCGFDKLQPILRR